MSSAASVVPASESAAPTPRSAPRWWIPPGRETLLLGLLALGIRLLAAWARPAILPDSADLLQAAEAVRERGLTAALDAAHHPLPVGLIAFLGSWFDPEAAGTVAAAVLGALAVAPLHVLARRACGRHGATTACLLYAVLPKFVTVASVPLADAMFLPFFVGAFAAASSAGIARTRRRRVFRLVAAGLSAAAAYLCRPEGLVAGVAVILGVAAKARRGRRVASAAVVAVVFVTAAAPWVGALSAERGALTLSPKKDLARFAGAAPAPRESGSTAAANGRTGIHATAEGLWDALGPALILVVAGALPRRRWSRRRSFRPRWMLLLTAVGLIALVVRLHAGWGYGGGRHLLPASVLLLPFAGEGAVAVFGFLSRARRRRRGALILTTLLAIPLGVRAVLRPDGEGGERERTLGETLAAADAVTASRGDVILASFGEPLVAYYADRALAPTGRRCRNVRLRRGHGRLLELSSDLEEQRAALADELRARGAGWLVLHLYTERESLGTTRRPGMDLAARLLEDGVLGLPAVARGSELAAFPVLPVPGSAPPR